MPFTLRDVPITMRRKGWTVGAQLMDRWFESPPWAMSASIRRGDVPAPAWAVDTKTVTMRWLLRFPRVATAYHKLLQDWSAPPRLAKSEKQVEVQFRRWLAANPRAPGTRFRFGNLARPVTEVNEHYSINFEVVDSPWYGDVNDSMQHVAKRCSSWPSAA